MLATLSLASLLVVGCKQDVGERCEQNSDCASGLCTDMSQGASAPGICEATLPTGTTSDAATSFPDAGADADGHVEAGAEVSGDAALESHVEAGGSDTSEAGAEVGSEAGAEAGSEAGAEAGAADGASGD